MLSISFYEMFSLSAINTDLPALSEIIDSVRYFQLFQIYFWGSQDFSEHQKIQRKPKNKQKLRTDKLAQEKNTISMECKQKGTHKVVKQDYHCIMAQSVIVCLSWSFASITALL